MGGNGSGWRGGWRSAGEEVGRGRSGPGKNCPSSEPAEERKVRIRCKGGVYFFRNGNWKVTFEVKSTRFAHTLKNESKNTCYNKLFGVRITDDVFYFKIR